VRWLALSLAMLALAGCKPDPKAMECGCKSGVFATGETCHCVLQVAEGKPLRRRMFSNFIKQEHDVALNGTVTVQKGTVKVWIEDKTDARHEILVPAGAPVKLVGRPGAERSAGSDDVTFSINVQAVGGKAEGVTVDFDYHVGE